MADDKGSGLPTRGIVPGGAVDTRTAGRISEKERGLTTADTQNRKKPDEDKDNVLLDV
jgi:hypothetical protein